MESNKDIVNNDHIYHKDIKSSSTANALLDTTGSSEFTPDLFFEQFVSNTKETPNLDLHCPPDVNFEAVSILDADDIGSDGNKSPYSDMSSAHSPGNSDDLNFDWNDSFMELFPQLG